MAQIDLRYFVVIAISVAVTIGAIAGINFFIDPYDRIGNNWIGHYLEGDRSAKAKQVQVYPHDSLLIGSSKVAFIDPTEISSRRRFYNAALLGALPEEMLSFIRVFGEKSELVVIGFDIFMFNLTSDPMRETDHFSAPDTEEFLQYLTSIDTLGASVDVVRRWLSGEPVGIKRHGQRNPWHIERLDAPFTAPAHDKVLWHLKNRRYANFVFAEKRLSVLRQMRELMMARQQAHIVFLNPAHHSELQMLKSIPAGRGLEYLRQEIKEIFPLAVDLTDGPWSGDGAFYYADPFHYRPETGKEFMRELLARCPVDGVPKNWRGC